MNTRIITKPAIANFPVLFEAQSVNGGSPKYSTMLMFDKDDEKAIALIRAGIQRAYEDGKNRLRGTDAVCPPLAGLRTPLRDGDAERPDSEIFAGKVFLTASSKRRPQVIDRDKRPITNPEEIYSGVICRASIEFYAYNLPGVGRGIGCALGNVQKVRNGERIGVPSAEEEFDELEDEAEDDVFLG